MNERVGNAESEGWDTSTQEFEGGRKHVLTQRGKGEQIYLNILAPHAYPDRLVATFFANHLATSDKQLLQRGKFRELLGELLKIAKTEGRTMLCVPAFNENINDLILRSGGELSESGPFPTGSLDISFGNLQKLYKRLGGRSIES